MPNSKRNLDDWNDDCLEDDLDNLAARRLQRTKVRPDGRWVYVVQTCHFDGEGPDPLWSPARGRAVIAFKTRASAEEYVQRRGSAYGLPLAVVEVEVSNDASQT